MKHILGIFMVSLSLSAISCSGSKDSDQISAAITTNDTLRSVSKEQSIIEVYTLGKVNNGIRKAIMDSLKSILPRCRYITNLPLPESAWYAPRQRYLADSLTNYLARRHTKDNVVVGLTEVDISIPLHESSNYGIMGLTNRVGGGVCVFSPFRKKSYSGLFCLMKHELGHAFGLRHCKTPECLMHDAEGSDLKGIKFCPQCSSFLKSKGWKLED